MMIKGLTLQTAPRRRRDEHARTVVDRAAFEERTRMPSEEDQKRVRALLERRA